jgi:hypothetical protein
MNKVVDFTLNILLIILSVVAIVGLYILTQFSFKAKIDANNNAIVSNVTKNKLTYTKVTVVVLWVQIFFALITSLWNMSQK